MIITTRFNVGQAVAYKGPVLAYKNRQWRVKGIATSTNAEPDKQIAYVIENPKNPRQTTLAYEKELA